MTCKQASTLAVHPKACQNARHVAASNGSLGCLYSKVGSLLLSLRLEMPSITDSRSLAAGMNGGLSLACIGHARPAASALTGTGNAQPLQSQKDITEEPQPTIHRHIPNVALCPDSCCEQLQPRHQPSSKHSGCNGECGQSQDKSAREQRCQWRAESAAQASGATRQARDAHHDSQAEEQQLCDQHKPADMTSGVDVTVEDASTTSPCNCRDLQQASIAVPLLQLPHPSAGETMISDETPQEAMQQQQAKPVSVTEGHRRGVLGRTLQVFGGASVSGLTEHASGAAAGRTERTQRAQCRRLAERAALQWEPERSTADSPPSRQRADSSFKRQNSSELDGSQGAAWGLATMLQVRDCLQSRLQQ